MSCTPSRPEVPRNRCSMGQRLPWARRLQSPCRTGEPSAAAQAGDPTRPDELTDIAGKPCARDGSAEQARATRCSWLPPRASISSTCSGPPRRRLQLHCCAHRAAEVQADQLPRFVIVLDTCLRKARLVHHVCCGRLLVAAVGLGGRCCRYYSIMSFCTIILTTWERWVGSLY